MQAREDRVRETPPSIVLPRVMPSTRFAQELGNEIRKAAQTRIQNMTRPQWGEAIAELRKLVLLLQRTLVPVRPREAFVHELGRELNAQSVAWSAGRQHLRRWLVVGGTVGSIVSVFGIVAALLVRRRNGHARKLVGLS